MDLESRTNPVCPLCRCEKGIELDVFPVADLRTAYLKQLHVDISGEFPHGLNELRLTQCAQCGLQSFHPACSGSAAFYAALSSGEDTYYSEGRWEFAETRRLLPAQGAVLDVGCGDGHFLAQLPQQNKMGIEFNPQAATKARGRGLNVVQRRIEEIGSHAFDAVTLFHVAEHLVNPLEFLQQAVRILRPGGMLIISVPNNDASIGSDLQHAANAPPHHALRWRAEPFRYLPQLLPIHLVQLANEPLNQAYLALYRRVQFFNWIEKTLRIRLPLMRMTAQSRIAMTFANLWARLAGANLPDKPADGFSLLAVFRKT